MSKTKQLPFPATLPITCAWLPRETCFAIGLRSCAPCDRYRDALASGSIKPVSKPQQEQCFTYRCEIPGKPVRLALPDNRIISNQQKDESDANTGRRISGRKRKERTFEDYEMGLSRVDKKRFGTLPNSSSTRTTNGGGRASLIRVQLPAAVALISLSDLNSSSKKKSQPRVHKRKQAPTIKTPKTKAITPPKENKKTKVSTSKPNATAIGTPQQRVATSKQRELKGVTNTKTVPIPFDTVETKRGAIASRPREEDEQKSKTNESKVPRDRQTFCQPNDSLTIRAKQPQEEDIPRKASPEDSQKLDDLSFGPPKVVVVSPDRRPITSSNVKEEPRPDYQHLAASMAKESFQTKMDKLCEVVFRSFAPTNPRHQQEYRSTLIREAASFLEKEGYIVAKKGPFQESLI